MENLKPGDIVTLRSGGPKMTVISISDDGVFCQWFDQKGIIKEATFLTTSIEKYNPDDDIPPFGIA